MVHLFLASPFADAARAGQFAALQTALETDAATDSLLLGNLVLEDGSAPLDAVVLRPHGITLLVLVPRGGELSIPALGYGGWQLAGAPLAGSEEFDNPFEQFRQQKAQLEAWLQPRFTPAQANLRFISGLVVFEAPLVFRPDVEAALNDAPSNFQLLADPADLPRRLRQLATPEIDLMPTDLAEWAAELNDFAAWTTPADASATAKAAPGGPAAAGPGRSFAAPDHAGNLSVRPPADQEVASLTEAAAAANSFLGTKARALWGWLGANDVPDDDLPYGYAATLEARNEEKQQLESLRQQMQADVTNQLQALEAREAEREHSIAQLRAELAQAPPVAAEATALVSRLGAETREKAALEAEMEASRAELAARNQELDTKIQQLSQLIGQLSAVPLAVAAPAAPEPPAPPATAVAGAAPQSILPQASAPAPAAPPATSQRSAAVAVPSASVSVASPSSQLFALEVAPEMSAAAATAATGAKLVSLVAESVAPQTGIPVTNLPPAAEPVAAESATTTSPVPASKPVISTLANPTPSPVGQPAVPGAPDDSAAAAAPLPGARVRAVGAALLPRLRQLAAGASARPKLLLGACGAMVLLLAVWALAHRRPAALVPYQENGRWGYANASGTPVIKAQYEAVAPFAGGQAVVQQEGAFGLVDEAGKALVAPAYDDIHAFRGGYARVRVGDAYTFLEESGQEFDHFFFNALDFAEGHAAVLDHRGWFYLNGPEVPDSPPIFREAYSFVDGLARVRLPDGYTFITPDYLANPASGTKPFGRYELAADFADGKARVTQKGRSFVIDKDGEEVK